MVKTSKNKSVKANIKNTTSNTVSEIQTSDSNPETGVNKNDSDSMGCNNLPDIVNDFR